MNTKSINSNSVTPVPTKTLPPAPAKKPKLTEWFDSGVKPARVGVYEREFWSCPGFQYWDGTRWHYGSDTPQLARAAWRKCKTGEIPRPRSWRGLASNPARKS